MDFKFKSAAALSIFACVTLAHAEPTKYEAEDQPDIEAASILTGEDFSGGKYVNPGSDGMTFTIKIDETAMYDITTKVLIRQYD